jgi:hypothetical protein
MLPRPGRLTITYHPPIDVEPLQEDATRLELKEAARQLARKTHDIVAGSLGPSSLPQADASDSFSLETNT